MNVSLTPALEEMIQNKVKTGLYTSTSEVVREALRLLEEKDRINLIKLEALRKDIQVGIDQINRGEVLDGKEVFRRIREKSKKPSRRS
ncbi:MAG: type II toxin-antitoxin system ParD family antitoxin [Deltaproteobacteria bacterium]|nr:MAG: type II toxin-antitoxin system ParD family antitoxin [Deltaproteobacteria bacterium]